MSDSYKEMMRGYKFSAVTEYGEVIPVRVNEEFYNLMCDEIEKGRSLPKRKLERFVRIASSGILRRMFDQ